jgi:asparagine synthase (glutamine-hydrolysing)
MPALAFYPIWQLYRRIKQSGISVTLDGQGADEMLGGYFIGSEALISGWQSRNLFRYRDLLNTYSALHQNAPSWMESAKADMQRYAYSEIDQVFKKPLKAIAMRLGIYRSRPSKMPRPAKMPLAVNPADSDANDWLAHKLWDQFFVNPLPFLLHQYDRCSMASGVECRMPFMDYRLVEFIFSLPLTARIGDGYTKRVLREAMKGLLPDNIRLNRLKTGFNAPFDQWLKGPMRDWFQDQLNSQAFIESKYFDGRSLQKKYSRLSSDSNFSWNEREIWPCIHLTWWQSQRETATFSS